MLTSHRPWIPQRAWAMYRVIMPAAAGAVLLLSSLLPWFTYPSGLRHMAWQLPVDLGWQLRHGLFNYGVLCLLCALYVFYVAYKAWTLEQEQKNPLLLPLQRNSYGSLQRAYIQAGFLALLPATLFLWQILLVDMQTVAELSRHQVELQLTKSHFGYNYDAMFVPIQPVTFDPLHIGARFALFADRVFIGFFISLISAIALFSSCSLLPKRHALTRVYNTKPTKKQVASITGVILLCMIILGRAPFALLCNNKAEQLLASGNYQEALKWLDTAQFFNPSLDLLPTFHVERGQAWYFLHPTQPTADSKAYLASYYRQQNDLIASYQEIQNAWQSYPQTLWLKDEVTKSLISLVEMNKPLKGAPEKRFEGANRSVTWLQRLITLDPQNTYGHFVLGRILYDLRDYAGSEKHMQSVLENTHHYEVESAAYTYIGLNKIGLGDSITARDYFFKAQELDPELRNNTARQHLSGLR